MGEGEFINPAGVAVDPQGFVYVGDFGENNNIQKFDSDGNFITGFGSSGTAQGQFSHPIGVSVSADGRVYVTDEGNARVIIFGRSEQWG